MGTFSVRDLKPGLVLQEDAYTEGRDQLILPRGTVLDEKKIAKLVFYAVPSVEIEERRRADAPVLQTVPEGPSYSERLRESKEFKKFKSDFEESFLSFQRSINEIIRGDREIDTHALIAPVYELIHQCYGPSNVFDMLHALREYDDATYAHSLNVALISHTLGEWMHLPEDDLQMLTEAGLLHDIGKIMLPQEIIKKRGELTFDEYEQVKQHPALGHRVLERKNVDRHIKNAVLQHHEPLDGSGYPSGLKMNEIDPFAKVVAIADVYDAMTSERLYRGALCPFDAIENFEQEGLQKYDTRAIMTFMSNVTGTYLQNRVRLSDGTQGEIVFINPARYSRPTVRVGRRFIDLTERTDLRIAALI